MTKKDEIFSIWEKMSYTKCWKWGKKFYKPSHLKYALYYMLIEGTIENGDEQDIGEMLIMLRGGHKLK
jgi:hypothetical protein